MEHEHWLGQISAALDGELSGAERRELDEHLAQCPDCTELFHELSQQSEALRRLDCTPPAHLQNHILSSLPPRQPAGKKAKLIRWRRWGALAACLVLVMLAGISLPRGASTGSVAPTPAAYHLDPTPAPDSRFVSGNENETDEYAAAHTMSQAGQVLALPALPLFFTSFLDQIQAASTERGEYLYSLVDETALDQLTFWLDTTNLRYQIVSTPSDGSLTAVVWPAP